VSVVVVLMPVVVVVVAVVSMVVVGMDMDDLVVGIEVINVVRIIITVSVLDMVVVVAMVVLAVVVVVVVMMMVVVMVVVVVPKTVLKFVQDALINGLLELDVLLVMLESVNKLVVEAVLELEPEQLVVQLAFELVDGFRTEFIRVVVVVAVVSVVVVVAVMTVMTMVVVVTVVMMGVDMMMFVMAMVVGMNMMHWNIVAVDLLSGDLRNGNVSGMFVVMNMTRDIVAIESREGIIAVGLNLEMVLSGDSLGQSGGETKKGNGDDGSLHFYVRKAWIVTLRVGRRRLAQRSGKWVVD